MLADHRRRCCCFWGLRFQDTSSAALACSAGKLEYHQISQPLGGGRFIPKFPARSTSSREHKTPSKAASSCGSRHSSAPEDEARDQGPSNQETFVVRVTIMKVTCCKWMPHRDPEETLRRPSKCNRFVGPSAFREGDVQGWLVNKEIELDNGPAAPRHFSGLGSRVSGLGSRGLGVSGSRGLGSRVSGLGSRVSGSRVSGLGVSGLGSRVLSLGSRVSGLGSRVSGLGSRGLGSRVSGLGVSGSARCQVRSVNKAERFARDPQGPIVQI